MTTAAPVRPSWATPASNLLGVAGATPSSYLDALPVDTFIRVTDMPGSQNSAYLALSRAVKNGELARVASGIYYKGKKTRYGIAAPPEDWLAFELLGRRGVGPTGWTAANSLGLTTQVAPKTYLATVLRPPSGLATTVFVRRNNVLRLDLSPAEISVLEILRDWQHMSDRGWPGVVDSVRRLIKDGEIRIDAVVAAAAWEHNAATHQGIAQLERDLDATSTDRRR